MPKLGAHKSQPDARDFQYAAYRSSSLPVVPAIWGFDNVIPRGSWGMLGNDQYGDCVWAGAAHEHILENAVAGRSVQFTTSGVLSDYSAVTGFTPDDPSTDNGTEIRTALKYRQKTGIIDAAGARHTIGAYLALDTTRIQQGDFSELAESAFLFGAVALGIEVPDSAMTQFNDDQMWSYVAGSPIDGGHYVPLIAHRKHLEVVTWGRVQPVGTRFLENYISEAWALVSPDFLNSSGETVQGFNLTQLNADLAQL